MGCFYRDGECGLPQDHMKALELWHRAGELGYALAHNNIGYSYVLVGGVISRKTQDCYLCNKKNLLAATHLAVLLTTTK